MSPLYERIYEAVKLIPKGKVATYGDIARHLGNERLSRVVGNALHVNPYEGIVPCHRVVDSKGRVACNFGFGGAEGQRCRLEAEGVRVVDERVDLGRYLFEFRDPAD